MIRKFMFAFVMIGMVAATTALAKGKLFVDTELYENYGVSMQLNAGSYDKLFHVKYWTYAWCKTGYNVVTDAELFPGKVYFEASNPNFDADSRVKQSQIAGTALFREMGKAGFAVKKSEGKHRVDIGIFLSERGISPMGNAAWVIGAETKVVDENGIVLFRSVSFTWDYTWQAAPNLWAKELVGNVKKKSKALSKGFGVDPDASDVDTPDTPSDPADGRTGQPI